MGIAVRCVRCQQHGGNVPRSARVVHRGSVMHMRDRIRSAGSWLMWDAVGAPTIRNEWT
jgi:hypothetical protein